MSGRKKQQHMNKQQLLMKRKLEIAAKQSQERAQKMGNKKYKSFKGGKNLEVGVDLRVDLIESTGAFAYKGIIDLGPKVRAALTQAEQVALEHNILKAINEVTKLKAADLQYIREPFTEVLPELQDMMNAGATKDAQEDSESESEEQAEVQASA